MTGHDKVTRRYDAINGLMLASIITSAMLATTVSAMAHKLAIVNKAAPPSRQDTKTKQKEAIMTQAAIGQAARRFTPPNTRSPLHESLLR